MVLASPSANGALWEKRYPVKAYGNEQILCDPYQVQPGDWLHRIFLRRGELAEYDFKTFSRIFKHLNPHVTSINRISSGDWILIPLKRLSTKTVVKDPSGKITIPFSSLKERPVSTHTVAIGDTISGLLMKRCGPLNSRSYKTCLALFRQLNPEVTDFNRIHPGQNLKLPGVLKKTGPGNPAHFKKRRAGNPKADITPLFPEKLNSRLLLQVNRLAQATQAKMMGRGRYHFPQDNGGVTLVDLGRSPLLQFKNGDRFLLIPPNLPTQIDAGTVRHHWPKATLVPLATATPDYFQLLDKLSKNLDPASYRSTLEFATPNGLLTLTAAWLIAPRNSDRGGLLLIPQDSLLNADITGSIKQICRKSGVLLRPITPNENSSRPPLPPAAATKMGLIDINPAPLKTRLKMLAFELGLNYRSDISVIFPYGGVFVEAAADALEDAAGQLYLIDNGQFAGQSIAAIKKAGLEVISLYADETLYNQLPQLLTQLKVPYKVDPEIILLDTVHLDVKLKLDGLMISRHPEIRPTVVLAGSLNQLLHPFIAALQTNILILKPQ